MNPIQNLNAQSKLGTTIALAIFAGALGCGEDELGISTLGISGDEQALSSALSCMIDTAGLDTYTPNRCFGVGSSSSGKAYFAVPGSSPGNTVFVGGPCDRILNTQNQGTICERTVRSGTSVTQSAYVNGVLRSATATYERTEPKPKPGDKPGFPPGCIVRDPNLGNPCPGQR